MKEIKLLFTPRPRVRPPIIEPTQLHMGLLVGLPIRLKNLFIGSFGLVWEHLFKYVTLTGITALILEYFYGYWAFIATITIMPFLTRQLNLPENWLRVRTFRITYSYTTGGREQRRRIR